MSPIGRFALAVVLWLPICYAAWYFFSIIFTVPLAATLDALLTWRFPQMFSGIEAAGNTLMVTTALTVEHSDPARAAVGLVRFQVHPLDYGYSVPLYTALVLAAPGNPPEKLLRWMSGVCILFVVQIFGVGTGILKTLAFDSGEEARERLAFTALHLNLLALSFKFGYLIFPPVSPIVIWVVQFRDFVFSLTRVRPLSSGS